jgi:hypothetical protein
MIGQLTVSPTSDLTKATLANFIETAVTDVQERAHWLPVIFGSLRFFHKRVGFQLHGEVAHE